MKKNIQYYQNECGCIFRKEVGLYTLIWSCIASDTCSNLKFNEANMKGKKLKPMSKLDLAILKMEKSK